MVLSKLFTSRTYGIITPISGNKTNSTSFCKRKSLNKYKNLIFYSNRLVKKQNSFEKINNSYILKKCNGKCLPKSNFFSNKASLGGSDSIFHLKRAKSFNFLKTNCNSRLSHSYNVCTSRNNHTFIQSHKNLVIRPKKLSSFKNFIQEKTYSDNAFNKNHDKGEENIKEKDNTNSMDEKNFQQTATKILANNVHNEVTSKTYENLCDSESTGNLCQERESDKKMQEKNFVKTTTNFREIPNEVNNIVRCYNSVQQNQITQEDNFKKEVVGEDFNSTENERESDKKMQEKHFVKNTINCRKIPNEINNNVHCYNSEQQNQINQEDNFKKEVVGEDFNLTENGKIENWEIEDYFKKFDLHVDRNKVISYYQKSTEDKMKAYCENNEEYFDNLQEIKPFVIRSSDSEKRNKIGNQECFNSNELPINNNSDNNSSTIMSNEGIGEVSETSPNYELMRKEEEIKISDEINNSNLDIKAEKPDIKKSHKLNLNCDILHKGVSKQSLKENAIHKTPENIDARNFSTVITHHEKFISRMEDIKSDPNLKKNNLLKTNYKSVNNNFLQKTMTENCSLKEKLEYADTKNSDYQLIGNSNKENSYKLNVDSNTKASTNETDNGEQSYKNLELYGVSDLGEAITNKYSHPNDDYNDNILNESSSEANSASLSNDKAEVLKIQQKILAAEKKSYSSREVGKFDRSLLTSENNISAGNDETELHKIQQKILAAEKKITGVMKNETDPQISQPIVFSNKGLAEQKAKTVSQGDRDKSRLQDEDDSDVYVLAPINEKNFNSLKDSEEEIFILTELPSNNMTANDSENTEYSIILNKNQMENLFDGKEYNTYESDKGVNKIINVKEKQYKISDVSTMKTNNLLDSENSSFIKNDSVINTSNSNEKKRSNDLKIMKKAISNNLSNNSNSAKMSKQHDRTGIEQLQQNNLPNFKKFNAAVEENKSKRNTKPKIWSGNNNSSNKVNDKNSTLSTKLFPGANNINNVVSKLKKITKHSCINKDKNFVQKETNNSGTSNKSVKKDNRSRRLYSNFCEKMDTGTGKHTIKDKIADYNNREQTKLNVIKKDSHNYRKFNNNIGGNKEFKINRHPLLNNKKVNLTHLKHYKTDQTEKSISNSEEIDDKNIINKALAKSNEIEAIKNNCKPKSNTGRDLYKESRNGLVNNIKNEVYNKKNNAKMKNVSKKMNEVNSDLLTDLKYFDCVNNCKETVNYKENIASTLKSVNFFRSDYTDTNNQSLVLSENENSLDKINKNDKADQPLFKNNDSDFVKTNKLPVDMFRMESSQKVLTKDEATSNKKSYKKDNENLETDPFGLRTGDKYREPAHSLKNNDEVKCVTNHGENFINSGLKDVFKSKSKVMNGKVNEFEDTSSKVVPATQLLKTREINWNDSVTIDDFTSENCEVEINKTKTIKAFEDKYPCKSYIKNYMDSENKVFLQKNKNVKDIYENIFSDSADVESKNTENKFTVDAFNSYQSPLNHSVHKKDDKVEQKHSKIPEKRNKSKYNSQIPKAIDKQFKNTITKNINCENNGHESEKSKNATESVLSMKTGSFEQNEIQCNSKSEDIIFSLLEEKVRASIDNTDDHNDFYIDNINETESPLYNFKINQNLRAWGRLKQGYNEDIVHENEENDTNKNKNADLPKQEIPASLKDELYDDYLKNEVSDKLSEIKGNVSIQKNYSNEIKNCDKLLNDTSTGMNEQKLLPDSVQRESVENENKSSILSNVCNDNGYCDNKLNDQSGSIPKHTLFQDEKTELINENGEKNMKDNFDYDKSLKVNDKNFNDDNINYCILTQNDTNVSKSEEYVDLFGSDGRTNAYDDNDAAEISSLIKLLSECYADQQNNSSSITDELLILGKKYKQNIKNEKLNSEQDSDEDNCNIESLLSNCMIEAASGCVEQDYSLEFIDSRTRLRLMEEIFEDEEKTLHRDNIPKTLSLIEADNNLLSDSKTGVKNINQHEENNTCETIDQDTKKTLVTKYSSNSEITSTIDGKKYEAPLLQVKDILNFGETIVNESCKMFKLETQPYLQTSQLSLNNSSMRNDCLPVIDLSKENKISNIPSKTDHTLKNNKNKVQIVAQRYFSTSSKSINEEDKSAPLERSFSLPFKSFNKDEKTDSFIHHEKFYSAPDKLINEERINTSFHHQKPFTMPFKSTNREETNIFVHGENLTENHTANLKLTEQPVQVSSMTDSGTEQRCFAILNGKKIDKRETGMFDMFDQHGKKLNMKIKLENENESTNLHNMSKQPVCNTTVNKSIIENKEFNSPLSVKKEIRQMAELLQNIKCLKHPTETYSSHAGNNSNKIEKNFFQSNKEALKNVCTSKNCKNDEENKIGEDFKKNSPYVMYPLLIVQDKLCSSLSQKQTNHSSISTSKLCCGVSHSTNRKFSCSCKDLKNSSTKEAIKKPEKNKQENILNENLTLIFPKDKKVDNPRPMLEKETGDKKSITGREILKIFHNHLIKKLKSTISNTENNKANNQSDQKAKLNINPPHVAKNSNVSNKLMRLRHYSGPFIRSSKETDSLADNKFEKHDMNSLNLDTNNTKNKNNPVISSKSGDEAVKKNKENQRKQLTGNINTLKEIDDSTSNKILKQNCKKHSKLPEKVNQSFDNEMKAQSDSDIASKVINNNAAKKISKQRTESITKLENKESKNTKEQIQTLAGNSNVVFSNSNKNKPSNSNMNQSPNNCSNENQSNNFNMKSAVSSEKIDETILDKKSQKLLDHKIPLEKDNSDYHLSNKTKDQIANAISSKENTDHNSINNSRKTLIETNEDVMKNKIENNDNLSHQDKSDSEAERKISIRDKDIKSCSLKETKQNFSKSMKASSQIPLPTKGSPLESALKIISTKKINGSNVDNSVLNNCDKLVFDNQQSEVKLSNENKGNAVKLNPQETGKKAQVMSRIESKSGDDVNTNFQNSSQMTFSLKNNTENTDYKTKTYLVDVQKTLVSTNLDTTVRPTMNILEPTTQTKEDEYCRAAVLYEVLDSDEFSVHENKTNGFTKIKNLAGEKNTDNSHNMINEMFTEVQEEIFLNDKMQEEKYDKCVKNESYGAIQNKDKQNEDFVNVKNEKSIIINKPDKTSSEKSDISSYHKDSTIIIKSAQKILSDGDFSESIVSTEKSESSTSSTDIPAHNNLSSLTNKVSEPIIVREENSRYGTSKEKKYSNSNGNVAVPRTLNKSSDFRESGDFEPDFNEYLKIFNRPNLNNFLSEYNFPITNDEKIDVPYPKGSHVVATKYDTTFLRKIFRQLPSVSTVLNNTLTVPSISALNKWKTKLTMKFGDRVYEKMNEDFINYDTQFHDYIQKYLSGIPLDELCATAHPAVKNCLESLKSVFSHLSDITFLETHTIHSQLPYHGIIDCVAQYKKTPVLIEWKQADSRTCLLRLTHDAPIQLAAYLGSFNHDKIYKFQVTSGLIVIAYTDGSPADVFFLSIDDCSKYWRVWLSRLADFLDMRKGYQNLVK